MKFAYILGLFLLVLGLSETPSYAMMQNIQPTDPKQTTCSGLVKSLHKQSQGGFYLAVDLAPVTEDSPVNYQPDTPSLYTDRAGLLVFQIDPESYRAIESDGIPAWLFISFTKDSLKNGSAIRTIGYAKEDACSASDSQPVKIEELPLDLKRYLLKALTDASRGGSGDPFSISADDDNMISNMFPSSVDMHVLDTAKKLGN